MSIDKIKMLQDWSIGKVIDIVFNFIINRTFKNPKSPLYYKKIIATFQYILSILMIFFALFLVSKSKLNNATKAGAAIALIFCLGLIVHFRHAKRTKIAESVS